MERGDQGAVTQWCVLHVAMDLLSRLRSRVPAETGSGVGTCFRLTAGEKGASVLSLNLPCLSAS